MLLVGPALERLETTETVLQTFTWEFLQNVVTFSKKCGNFAYYVSKLASTWVNSLRIIDMYVMFTSYTANILVVIITTDHSKTILMVM